MAKLRIKNLGPIKDCKMEINDNNFMVLTGQQASGKSTIVKCVYFFKSVKEIIKEALNKNIAYQFFEGKSVTVNFAGYIRTLLRQRFLDLFGSSQAMDNNMSVRYDYNDEAYIEIGLTDYVFNDTGKTINNYLNIKYSQSLYSFLNKISKANNRTYNEMMCFSVKEFEEITNDFDTPYFIPAGRNLMSLLTSQLNYFIFSLDDNQK